MDFDLDLNGCMKVIYLVLAFFTAFILGALKGLLVGPIAGLILIIGNVGVILGLFPAHVAWTVYTLVKVDKFDAPLKVAILFALPALFGLWFALSISGSVLVGVGYGFFTPWISTFEAFRHSNDSEKFLHCFTDGTWATVKGSCTVVRDFWDLCYHSYRIFLEELRESHSPNELHTLRFILIPACILVGLAGVIVEVPFYAAIAVVKSPYMLFKGWSRLLHDLIAREGPFHETVCIPVAGLTIIMWPLVVVASILLSIFSSIFIGLYASVVVCQERSFRGGVAYLVAMVAEFDEITNDLLYLREGTILPKPQYRKRRDPASFELARVSNNAAATSSNSMSMEPPAMLVPSLAQSVFVREAIQEVKMVQVWENIMTSCELRGKQLLDADVLKLDDLNAWLKEKDLNETSVVGDGLPCYALLQTLLHSIKSNSSGILLIDGVEVNNLNRPKDKLVDWFFNPLIILKDQIKSINMQEDEVRFLEEVVLFGDETKNMETWQNGSSVHLDALRAAQIQGISRRMNGIVRSITKLPTYRRRYNHVVEALVAHCLEKESRGRSSSPRSSALDDAV